MDLQIESVIKGYQEIIADLAGQLAVEKAKVATLQNHSHEAPAAPKEEF